MKSFQLLLAVFITVLAVMISFTAFAQNGDPPGGGEIAQHFATFAALVAIIPVVFDWIKGLLNPPPGLWTQILSWITGLIITAIGWLLNLGMLDPLTFWQAMAVGIGASLAANGLFDTGIVTALLKLLGLLPENNRQRASPKSTREP